MKRSQARRSPGIGDRSPMPGPALSPAAAEYRNLRERQIDGALRMHMYYGMKLLLGVLPDDLSSPEYARIARSAIEREASILKAMGVRRLAPGEGPQMVKRS